VKFKWVFFKNLGFVYEEGLFYYIYVPVTEGIVPMLMFLITCEYYLQVSVES
jgi:hypothetical protein